MKRVKKKHKKYKDSYDFNSCNCNCNKFRDFNLPPCAEFLGSYNPLIKDGKIVYRNHNRLYFFLTYNYSRIKDSNYNTLNPLSFNFVSNANLQIDLYCFLIGIYINEVEKGNINYDSNTSIHEDENADTFIKIIMGNNYDLESIFIPALTYTISNSEAIVPLYHATVEISITNFYIILMLSRFNSDYGLLFSDNAYVTNDFINRTLANLCIEFNTCNNKY